MPFCGERYEESAYANKRRRLNQQQQFPSHYLIMARRAMERMEEEEEARYWSSPAMTKEPEQEQDAETDPGPNDVEPSFASHHAKVEHPEQVVRTSSREELMECIKRGQRPQWVPNPGLQALQAEEEALRIQRLASSASQPINGSGILRSGSGSSTSETVSRVRPEIEGNVPVERPRSALHRGNFADNPEPSNNSTDPISSFGLALSTSQAVDAPSEPWQAGSPRPQSIDITSHLRSLSRINTHVPGRRRAPSLGSSLSSSFVMRTPTSPLVYATSHGDLQDHEFESRSAAASSRDRSRRRTMPPNSFQSYNFASLDDTTPNFSRPLPSILRREHSMPIQGHQPRRSLTSFTYHPRSSPQTPLPSSRRASAVSDMGHRRRASMVGSFEESILRGRMSSPASKPFDFVAQIGVMGKGDCPSNLKCPAHVTVPFPAVFYNYPTPTQHPSPTDNSPSPYVGTIDLRNNLKDVTLSNAKKPKPTRTSGKRKTSPATAMDMLPPEPIDSISKLHVGGAYRVPRQGQLQIIIKNPNKTAVKLFLVPYDLQGMMPGTKTFIRQRSYSTGPIVDSVRSEDSARTILHDPLQNKQILRYLIHLRFCCPAKDRYYLYDDIRVVFANRVPDGKEKLLNEVQVPEPRFSTWKPIAPTPTTRPSNDISSTPTGTTAGIFGDMEDLYHVDSPHQSPSQASVRHDLAAFDFSSTSPNIDFRHHLEHTSPQPLMQYSVNSTNMIQSPSSENISARSKHRAISPVTGFAPTTPLRGSPLPWKSANSTPSRGFSPGPHEVKDSLLSKQFKELLKTGSPYPLQERDVDSN